MGVYFDSLDKASNQAFRSLLWTPNSGIRPSRTRDKYQLRDQKVLDISYSYVHDMHRYILYIHSSYIFISYGINDMFPYLICHISYYSIYICHITLSAALRYMYAPLPLQPEVPHYRVYFYATQSPDECSAMVSMQSALDYLLLLYIATTLLYTTKLDAWYYIHYITSLRNCLAMTYLFYRYICSVTCSPSCCIFCSINIGLVGLFTVLCHVALPTLSILNEYRYTTCTQINERQHCKPMLPYKTNDRNTIRASKADSMQIGTFAIIFEARRPAEPRGYIQPPKSGGYRESFAPDQLCLVTVPTHPDCDSSSDDSRSVREGLVHS